jgi:hypothetical protein
MDLICSAKMVAIIHKLLPLKLCPKVNSHAPESFLSWTKNKFGGDFTYQGEIDENGEYDGSGIILMHDAFIISNFKHGKKHGLCIMYTSKGDRFHTEFKDDCWHGKRII